MSKIHTIRFIDPSNLTRYKDSLYLYERTVLSLTKYLEYLRHNNIDLAVKISFTGGTEESHTVPSGSLVKVNKDILSSLDLEKFSTGSYFPGELLCLLLNEKSSKLDLDYKNTVYTIEFPLSVRLDRAGFKDQNILQQMRTLLGATRTEIRYRSLIKKAAGIQFNGKAAQKSYGRLNQNQITFYDHRVTAIDPDIKKSSSEDKIFKIAFSGKFSKIKGAHLLPEISRALYQEDKSIQLHVMGEGEYAQDILKKSEKNVIMHGFMPYKEGWEPFVSKNIDVMILPHMQGDPSMTYFEAMGMGAPVIGYDNETLKHLVDQNLALSLPPGDITGLIQQVIYLKNHPYELQELRSRCLNFMQDHLYQKVIDRRMEHLVDTVHGKNKERRSTPA